jgi:hypothetical protein
MSNTTIQLKHSTASGNTPLSLELGEIAINLEDGKIFYSNSSNVIKSIQNFPGPAGLNTEVQFNDNGELGSNASFTFDKSTGELSVDKIFVSNTSSFGGTQLSTTTTDQETLFSFDVSEYSSGKFVVLATESTRKQVAELLVIHDGVNAYATEYAIIRTDGNIFNLEVDIDNNKVRLLTTGNTSDQIDYKVSYNLL